MPYTFYKAEVTEVIDETASVRRFRLCIPELRSFDFQAGQFVMLDLPITSRITTRSYSIASAPYSTSSFELLIVLKPGGPGTGYLFSEIRAGSVLKVSQPLGKFVLPAELNTEICFISTGTGIAPFRSMIQDILNKQRQHRGIHLIFGSRFVNDILYREEWPVYEKKLDNFRFVPVLSRESSPEWSGHRGYVHSVYEELFKDRRPATFYICGWLEMLKEARQRLMDMGYDRSSIKFESYD
jgi:ferredoxin-NADP reductase